MRSDCIRSGREDCGCSCQDSGQSHVGVLSHVKIAQFTLDWVLQANEFVSTGYFASMETAAAQAHKAMVADSSRSNAAINEEFTINLMFGEEDSSQKVMQPTVVHQ